jgi:putative ABC transport system ATP-binding protein
MALFQELNRQGKTIVLVTHEKEISEHCKRIIFFRDGRVESDVQIESPVDARIELASLPVEEDEPVA